jgi:hypothetical protein
MIVVPRACGRREALTPLADDDGRVSNFKQQRRGQSLPGLIRQSIAFVKMFLRRWMDARIKSGHDELFL